MRVMPLHFHLFTADDSLVLAIPVWPSPTRRNADYYSDTHRQG